ncbi:hypothetical protein [Xanthomonas sp. LMG 12461]|uniref:hypothetical protein n=1 Tax=Xanthomonas sp. LMG 12461 TaxID=2014543 RepID=UPI00186B0215|nr:hypothetical protein [Xanthomonas sp. LMG 12461]
MGSILTRRRKNGSLGYIAIIRLKRDGKAIVSESATFDRRQLANEWMRRREAELDQQRARGEPVGKAATLTELLEWYSTDIKDLTPWGRTKEADLERLAGYRRWRWRCAIASTRFSPRPRARIGIAKLQGSY